MPDDLTIRREELGDQLRALRVAAGYSAREAARVVNIDQSQLSRIERGHRNPSVAVIASLLTLYRAGPTNRKHLLELAQEADQSGLLERDRPSFEDRQRTLTWLEGKAERIVNFETAVVPGLLQTGQYTRAILEYSGLFSDDEIEDRMVTRLRRFSVVMRKRPPELFSLIDECVLHRAVGGPDVLRRQLDHLLETVQRPNVTVRVLPNGCVGFNSPFALLHLPRRSPVVFLENLTSSLFLEERSDVSVYLRALKHLASRALDESQSAELIATAATQLEAKASSV